MTQALGVKGGGIVLALVFGGPECMGEGLLSPSDSALGLTAGGNSRD